MHGTPAGSLAPNRLSLRRPSQPGGARFDDAIEISDDTDEPALRDPAASLASRGSGGWEEKGVHGGNPPGVLAAAALAASAAHDALQDSAAGGLYYLSTLLALQAAAAASAGAAADGTRPLPALPAVARVVGTFQSFVRGGECTIEDGSAQCPALLSDAFTRALFGLLPDEIRAVTENGSEEERMAYRQRTAAPMQRLMQFEGYIDVQVPSASQPLVISGIQEVEDIAAYRAALSDRR